MKKRDHEKKSDKKRQSEFSLESLVRSGTHVVGKTLEKERSEGNVHDKSAAISKADTTDAPQESEARLQGIVVGPDDVTGLGQEQAGAASPSTEGLPGDGHTTPRLDEAVV